MQQELKPITIGIIGGGQLGRMICFEAHKMGFRTIVLCDKEGSPASFVTNKTIVADYDDRESLASFAQQVDVATFEFENIPYETVNFINQKISVYPNPKVLKITQNRILEKSFLQKIGVEVSDFLQIESLEDLLLGFNKFSKSILKTATMGYDGKGQFVLESEDSAKAAWDEIKNNPIILEKFCPFDLEISVLVARSTAGEIKSFAPVHNEHKNSILDKTSYPAPISNELQIKAQNIAQNIAKELDMVGILAVEFFVINDKLLVNELAPRPHNSGHITMDLCLTSQFEQLIRSIMGLKLGNSDFFTTGYMKNLIGEDVLNWQEYCNDSQSKLHLYGKNQIKDGRKMGHVNVFAPLK